MKKIFLLSVILLLPAFIFADNKDNQELDSIVTKHTDGTPYQKTTYEHKEDGTQIESVMDWYNGGYKLVYQKTTLNTPDKQYEEEIDYRGYHYTRYTMQKTGNHSEQVSYKWDSDVKDWKIQMKTVSDKSETDSICKLYKPGYYYSDATGDEFELDARIVSETRFVLNESNKYVNVETTEYNWSRKLDDDVATSYTRRDMNGFTVEFWKKTFCDDELLDLESYNYDVENQMGVKLSYSIDYTNLNSWASGKIISYYNDSRKAIRQEEYKYDKASAEWKMTSMETNEYDERGNITKYVYYVFSPISDFDVNEDFQYKITEYEYNESGKKTLQLDYYWDAENSDWSLRGKEVNTYDERGDLIYNASYIHSTLDLNIEKKYTYDDQHRWLSCEEWHRMPTGNPYKTLTNYSYTPDGTQNFESYTYNYTKNEYEFTASTLHLFDDDNNLVYYELKDHDIYYYTEKYVYEEGKLQSKEVEEGEFGTAIIHNLEAYEYNELGNNSVTTTYHWNSGIQQWDEYLIANYYWHNDTVGLKNPFLRDTSGQGNTYNLNGMRVFDNAKGIVIKDGRKIVR